MIKLSLVILIFSILIIADKTLTVFNIIQVNKNFPDQIRGDTYKIERNPLARWFFNFFGLYGGSVAYAVVTLITLLISYTLIGRVVGEYYAFYFIFLAYCLVVGNNTFFLLKYSKILP